MQRAVAECRRGRGEQLNSIASGAAARASSALVPSPMFHHRAATFVSVNDLSRSSHVRSAMPPVSVDQQGQNAWDPEFVHLLHYDRRGSSNVEGLGQPAGPCSTAPLTAERSMLGKASADGEEGRRLAPSAEPLSRSTAAERPCRRARRPSRGIPQASQSKCPRRKEQVEDEGDDLDEFMMPDGSICHRPAVSSTEHQLSVRAVE